MIEGYQQNFYFTRSSRFHKVANLYCMLIDHLEPWQILRNSICTRTWILESFPCKCVHYYNIFWGLFISFKWFWSRHIVPSFYSLVNFSYLTTKGFSYAMSSHFYVYIISVSQLVGLSVFSKLSLYQLVPILLVLGLGSFLCTNLLLFSNKLCELLSLTLYISYQMYEDFLQFLLRRLVAYILCMLCMSVCLSVRLFVFKNFW